MTLSHKIAKASSCDTCPLKYRHLCQAVLDATDTACAQRTRRMRSVRAETRLQEENEGPKLTGILRKGYLRAERILLDGRRSVLGFFAPGDLIGDVMGSIRGPALVAATDAEICVLDPVAMRRAMQEDTTLNSQILAETMRQHTRQLEMVWRRGALNSRERIAAFMVLAAEFMPVERLPDGSVVLSILVGRKDWADFANTTVETISRTLTYLSEKDMVQTVAPGRYRIRDIGALAKLAGMDKSEDLSAMVFADCPKTSLRDRGKARASAARVQVRRDKAVARRSV